jgi:HAD superfamily hydrolase (TIGR01484 family)
MGRLQPISGTSFNNHCAKVKLLATDMDGTLTHQGKFTAALLRTLETFRDQGLPVLVVTGRSAGWVHGLAHYLPIAGAMAENGGVYFSGSQAAPELLVEMPPVATHRQQLADLFQLLKQQVPQLETSTDNPFRLTDWTFDVTGLSPDTLDQLRQTCLAEGYGFTYSTVQCHLFPRGQSKAHGLLQVLARHFPHIDPTEVLTVGDSPNDESLFNPAIFPHSVGVANLQAYCDRLAHLPTYLTTAPEVAGFLELSQAWLKS